MTAPGPVGDEVPPLPWALRDFGRLVWFEVIAAAAIAACFVGAREAAAFKSRLYWIVGAVVALVFAGSGWAVWLLIGARALRDRQRRIMTALRPCVQPEAPELPPSGEALVSGARMNLYHRSGCPLVSGKKVARASREAHHAKGRRPCGVCAP